MKILENVNGRPMVLAESDTHLIAVRDWPARPSAREFVVWSKDIGGGVSCGSYFPVQSGDGTDELLAAAACFAKRAGIHHLKPKPALEDEEEPVWFLVDP